VITNHPAPGRPESIRMTGGLIAFVALMVAPMLLVTAIVVGAWAVSGEVYAAERAAASGAPGAPEVAQWKTTLVLVCPIH